MTNKNQRQGGPKGSLIGSVLIMFVMKILGGLSRLFHIKGSYSSMNAVEREFFSSMLDGMRQDLDKKDR